MDKNITYLNKTFSDFKSNLTNYAKTYFPNTANDFSEATPGNMFIEMASYVGDVMSFYIDNQIQENFLLYAKEKENLYAMAYALGYRPKMSYASSTSVDIYQLVPSITISGSNTPDYVNYGLTIPENTILTSASTGQTFITVDKLDFSNTGSTEISFVDANYYLLKKSVNVMSAQIKSTSYTFGEPQKFQTVNLIDDKILQIIEVIDINANKWYEVPYLAQSTVFDKIANPNYNTDQVPYLLNLKKVPRRFVTRFKSDGSLQLEFGAGISDKTDTNILPNPDNINLGLVPGISNLQNNYNRASIFFTQEYGLAPSNTIMTVRYIVGGGIEANIPSNDLTIINTEDVFWANGTPSNVPLRNAVLASVVSNNPQPAFGGRDGDEIEEIRLNTLNAYSSQLRAVNKNDYIVRALSMPSEYGAIAKVYISQNFDSNNNNPLSLDLNILAYDSNKNLITASDNLKNNLVTYINQYRMVTDAINIKDAFCINIGVNFDITVQNGYNNSDVLTNCILSLQDYFAIEKWQINQPIITSEITSKLIQVKGVQSIVKFEIVNKQGGNYSPYGYDINAATRKGNIYPSVDPSIFEIKYPSEDIQGRVSVL